jgi:hypothetical protein
MASPLFFRVFFSRPAVIAGAAALAVLALYREPDKWDLLKKSIEVSDAMRFCKNKGETGELTSRNCFENFRKLRQFTIAIGEDLLPGTLERCASAGPAEFPEAKWACLRLLDGSFVKDHYKRPF